MQEEIDFEQKKSFFGENALKVAAQHAVRYKFKNGSCHDSGYSSLQLPGNNNEATILYILCYAMQYMFSSLMNPYNYFRGTFEKFTLPDDEVRGIEAMYGRKRKY